MIKMLSGNRVAARCSESRHRYLACAKNLAISSRAFFTSESIDSVNERNPAVPVQPLCAKYVSLLESNTCFGLDSRFACVVLRSPDASEHSFLTPANPSKYVLARPYIACNDDITSEEILYGVHKESSPRENARCRSSTNTTTALSTSAFNENRLNIFAGGRIALRRALKLNANATTAATAATADTIHILANKHGAPLLPAHMHGSISHKDHLALGVGGFSSSSRVGCDIERVQGKSKNSMRLMSRIITPVERAQMGHFQVPIEEETLLYFSLKESIFKAIHPFLARQVDFDEVLVKPSLDGTVEVSFQLRSSEVSDVEGSRGNNRSPQNSSDAVRLQPSDIGLGRDYESFLDLVCTARWALYDESGGDRSYWLTFAEVHDASGLGDPNASNSL